MSDENFKPVIFVAFANDQDDRVNYLRNLPEEARKIRDPIKRACRDGLCEFEERSNASASDVFRVFQSPECRDQIAIFHYGGHANGYQLLLESSDGQPAAADAGGFADFLGQQKELKLVFLNGCSTQRQVEGLLKANVPAVIATSRAIDDQVAMHFAHQFYQGLAGGASIRTAFNEAVASIQTAKGGNTRTLYFKGKDQPADDVNRDRNPWELYLKDGSEAVADWSLPIAVGDPLFGLPPLPFNELPESPFRHLCWFDAEHADVFFGRGHQIRDLYEMLTRPDSTPIVLLYGQSGVGKSSLLSAGLLPRMEEEHEVRYVRRDQELGLLGSVKQALAKNEFDGESSIHFGDDWADVEQTSSKPLVLIVDQLEECFTRPNPELPGELDEFLIEINAILGDTADRPHGRLILGFRKEWLAEIESRLQRLRLARTKVFLERLGRRGIIEAILGPTATERLTDQYGLTVEPGLAETIADDLLADAGSAIAPTLQILLTKMWDRAIAQDRSHPCFDRELYSRLQKEGILLQDFLDQQLRELRIWQPDVIDSGLVLDLLTMHTTSLGTAAKRDAEELPQSYPHRAEVLESLVQKCKDLYLLVDPSQDQSSTDKGTRLSHDTLAPLIRARFEESDKPGQRARRILDNRVADWKDDHEGTPLDDLDLQVVELGQAGSRALNETEQRLLKASRNERDKRIRVQRLLKFTAAAAVLIIFALAVVIAVKQTRIADSQTQLANEKTTALEEQRNIIDEFYTNVSEEVLFKQPGMSGLQQKLLEKAKEFYEQLDQQKDTDSEVASEDAGIKYKLGRVYEIQGKDVAALKMFRAACKIQGESYGKEPAYGKMKDSTVQKNALAFSKSLTEIGNTTADLVEKEQVLEAARHIRNRLVLSVKSHDDEWSEYQLRLADTYMNIGNFDKTQRDLVSAKSYYDLAQSIRQNVLESLSSVDLGEKNSEQILNTHRDLGNGFYNIFLLYTEMYKTSVREWLQTRNASFKDQYKQQEGLIIENAENAIEQFRKVLSGKNYDGNVVKSLATSNFTVAFYQKDQEKFQIACDELEEIATANPTIPDYKLELARINYEWGNRTKTEKLKYYQNAMVQCELILDSDDSNESAIDRKKKVQAKIDELE